MKQRSLIKTLSSFLLVIVLVVVPVVPVRAETVSGDFSGAEYSLEQRQAISEMSFSWRDTCDDFNIIVGKTKSVKLIFPDELDTDGVTVTYKSSDSKIASVSKKGKLTAKKKGTVRITTVFKDGYGNIMTYVSKVVVVKDEAELKEQEAIDNMSDILIAVPDIKKGKKVFIEIAYQYDRHLDSELTGYGSQEIKKISYKIKNTKIATVSKKGYITGKKKGTTKLTITFKDIYGYSYSRTIDITVQ